MKVIEPEFFHVGRKAVPVWDGWTDRGARVGRWCKAESSRDGDRDDDVGETSRNEFKS